MSNKFKNIDFTKFEKTFLEAMNKSYDEWEKYYFKSAAEHFESVITTDVPNSAPVSITRRNAPWKF